MKARILILFIALSVGALMHAQWYFETGVNGTKFAEYVNLSGTRTTLHSHSGFRDFSYTVGYTIPFNSLEERFERNGKSSLFRLGLGVGFDQMNLRTSAEIGNTNIPVDFNMAQANVQFNILMNPTLVSKQEEGSETKRPLMNLLLEGGLAYNFYTNATRSYASSSAVYTLNLLDDNEFVNSYPAFTMGGGLEFPISAQTTIYGKYVVENAFSNGENPPDTSVEERFSTVKRRVMVGLRIDYKLKRHNEESQKSRLATLEEKAAESEEVVDLNPLHTKLQSLEAQLKDLQQEQKRTAQKIASKQEVYNVKDHDKGFMYLPEFKRVLFPIKSSYFDMAMYKQSLKDLATFMIAHPQFRLKLVGYADSITGTPTYNKTMSEKRALRVFEFLKNLGVDPQRMQHIGEGETLKFSIDELSENRRTEIIILEK